MEFVKEIWKKQDIEEYYWFSQTLIGDEKSCTWEQKIVNTKLKCFGKTSDKAKKIVKEIKKGNFVSFIDNLEIKTHLDSLISAYLISIIKDFEVFEQKLDRYVETIDNWASCDTLNFSKKDYVKLSILSKKYLKSKKPFVRRVGINIYFELIKEEKYLDEVFVLLNSLKDEKEYYVNMCASWLLCECFVKYKEKTFGFFRNNSTNAFIINKAISKCHDSFRILSEDKNELQKYRIKNYQNSIKIEN